MTCHIRLMKHRYNMCAIYLWYTDKYQCMLLRAQSISITRWIEGYLLVLSFWYIRELYMKISLNIAQSHWSDTPVWRRSCCIGIREYQLLCYRVRTKIYPNSPSNGYTLSSLSYIYIGSMWCIYIGKEQRDVFNYDICIGIRDSLSDIVYFTMTEITEYIHYSVN